MKIEITEDQYKAMCELAKKIPTELCVDIQTSKKGNERIMVDCRQGPIAHCSGEFAGSYMIEIVKAANLLREISYKAQMYRLADELVGIDSDF